MPDLTTTTRLLETASNGDVVARDALIARYLPRLRRWAHGRLPAYGRDLAETDDIVQITLMRALSHIEGFENRRPGAFLAYLRTILMNTVRDEIRRTRRAPRDMETSISGLATHTSAVEHLVGKETLERYEASLAAMPEEKRTAVVMRVEFNMSYQEIANELEKTSANATRMMIVRSLTELAESMHE